MTTKFADRPIEAMRILNSAASVLDEEHRNLLAAFSLMDATPDEYIDDVHTTAVLEIASEARSLRDRIRQVIGWMLHYDQLRMSKESKETS